MVEASNFQEISTIKTTSKYVTKNNFKQELKFSLKISMFPLIPSGIYFFFLYI